MHRVRDGPDRTGPPLRHPGPDHSELARGGQEPAGLCGQYDGGAAEDRKKSGRISGTRVEQDTEKVEPGGTRTGPRRSNLFHFFLLLAL